jgi:hypothetical protein
VSRHAGIKAFGAGVRRVGTQDRSTRNSDACQHGRLARVPIDLLPRIQVVCTLVRSGFCTELHARERSVPAHSGMHAPL